MLIDMQIAAADKYQTHLTFSIHDEPPVREKFKTNFVHQIKSKFNANSNEIHNRVIL